ncbi:MAG TPA: cupin domain-containing protein [Streptosporangiaceae bacterium]|nr:cupin domain-containing protein [Streptosporangiaceae bacterium]
MTEQDYAINYAPMFEALQLMDVQAVIDQVTDPWYNQTLIGVGDVVVRLGVMQGEFHWHKHDDQDEFFFVLDGLFKIELEDQPTVELGPRQAFSVPAGMLHRPVVPEKDGGPDDREGGSRRDRRLTADTAWSVTVKCPAVCRHVAGVEGSDLETLAICSRR